MSRLNGLIDLFPKAKVLVVGDLMVDHYIWGSVSRISPEAPVPVVEVASESIRPGGAANVFSNIVALDGGGALCGVIGNDEAGRWLAQEVKAGGGGQEGLVVEQDRPTIQKTRVVAHSQQVVRFDRERRELVSEASADKILKFALAQLDGARGGCQCVILSDYAKGVLTPSLTREVIERARRKQIPIIADPKVRNMDLFREVSLITPNHLEAEQASGVEITDEESLIEAGRRLIRRLNSDAVLITRGEKGMSLFERNGAHSHIPTRAKQVFDVTGAGDTVVATLSLAIASGATMAEAADLANHAAGVVVGIVGTATASRDSLRATLTER